MNKLFLSLTILTMILLASCQKDGIQTDTTKDGQTTNSIGLELPTNIKIEDGIMHFDDLEHFTSTMNALSDTKTHIRTTEELNQWEQSLGFVSMESICQKVLEEKNLELEQITNQNELDAFVAANSDNVEVTIYEDGSVELNSKFNDPFMGRLINEEGFVYINGTLSLMDNEHQIIVLDNDMDKARNAKISLQDNPKDGVYVFQSIHPLKTDCLDKYGCGVEIDPPNRARRKVSGEWRIKTIVTETNTVQTNTEWLVSGQLECTMRSKIRKGIGWFNNWNDWMGWEIGYTVQGDLGEYASGTGWSSETAKIDHTTTFLQTTFFGNDEPNIYQKFKYIGAWVDNEEYGDNIGDWDNIDTDPELDCRCWVNCPWGDVNDGQVGGGPGSGGESESGGGTSVGGNGSGSNQDEGCKSDDDCPTTEHCYNGKCIPW